MSNEPEKRIDVRDVRRFLLGFGEVKVAYDGVRQDVRNFYDNIKGATLVVESEGIGSNDNDTTLPTSAAVNPALTILAQSIRAGEQWLADTV